MMFVHPDIDELFDFDSEMVNSLVIENPALFSRFVRDIKNQADGLEGDSVLSVNDMPVRFDRNAEVIDVFIPFDINRKKLLTKIISKIEGEANDATHYNTTMEKVSDIMNYLEELSFFLPCSLDMSALSIQSIIKAASPRIVDDSDTISESLLNYFELVYDLDAEKVFFLVNLRSYIEETELGALLETARSHGYKLFLINSFSKPVLPIEKRITVDNDLCVF